MAMNKVTLVGRPTTAPELSYLESGKAVTRFTLAVARDYKDQDGNRPADFIRCVIWGNDNQSNRATNFSDYVNQGDLVDVTGRIETRSFEGENGLVYMTEVNVEEFHFLAQKQGEAAETQTGNQGQGNNRNNNNRNNNNNRSTTNNRNNRR